MWHARTPHDHHAAASALVRQALLLGSAGALLWNSWRCVHRAHRLRHDARSRRLPVPLQTWEGEGGRPDPQPPATQGEVAAQG
jgi:hypothetical protein